MITILNCDFDPIPETNGAELLRKHLKNLGVDSERFNVFDNQFPEKLEKYSGAIITGSRASVYEKDEWIRKLSEFVKVLDKKNIPTLGICFGFQIVAQSLEGEVKTSGSFEEGFGKIELTSEGKGHFLFKGLPLKIDVYQSHGDIATRLPENAKIFAKNNHSIQSYSVRNFFCVQFHPEILPETAKKMALRDNNNVNKILGKINMDYFDTLNVIFNFLEYCKSR